MSMNEEYSIEEALAALGLAKVTPESPNLRRPMTVTQFQRRIKAFTKSEWPWPRREQDVDGYKVWKAAQDALKAAASEAFEFNTGVSLMLPARDRLALPVASEGRAEVRGMVSDGQGGEVEAVIASAVEPVPLQIEAADEEGKTVMVDNPAIAQDLAERAAAQAVLDALPADVLAFDT